MRKLGWITLALAALASPALGQEAAIPLSSYAVRLDGGSPLPSGYLTIQDEGVNLSQQPTLNFVGAGSTCVDDAANFRTTCTITGGGGSTPTGTGFPHITAGVQDAAAKLVDTADVNAAQITLAKIQNAAANSKVLGSGSSGSGASYSEITLGTNLSMSGTTLNQSFDPTTTFFFSDDFTGNHGSATSPQADEAGYIVANAGAGTTFTTAGVANHPGILGFRTGATAAGGTTLNRENASRSIVLNGHDEFRCIFNIPVLSTGASARSNWACGLTLGNSTTSFETQSGIEIQYNDAISGVTAGNFGVTFCKATVCGTFDTGVAAVAATWYDFYIVANSSTSYEIWVNGVDKGAFSTAADIPAVALSPHAAYFLSGAGTTSYDAWLDFFSVRQTNLSR